MTSDQVATELRQLETELVELKAESDRCVAAYQAEPTEKNGKRVTEHADKSKLLELRIDAKRTEHAAALEAEAAEAHDAALADLVRDSKTLSIESFRARTDDRVGRLAEAERMAEALYQELEAEAREYQAALAEIVRRAAALGAPAPPAVRYADELGIVEPNDIEARIIGLRARQRDIEAQLVLFARQTTLGKLCPAGSNDEITALHAELRALQRRLRHLIVPAPIVAEDTPKTRSAQSQDFLRRLGLRP
jgi:hypothetical protein